MFYKSLLTLAIALIFTACGSETPQEIAIQLCEDNKVANFEGIKKHASKELKGQLDELKVLLENLEKTKEGKRLIEEQKKFQQSINCKESTTITKQEDGSFKISNSKTELNFTLKRIDDVWLMFKSNS